MQFAAITSAFVVFDPELCIKGLLNCFLNEGQCREQEEFCGLWILQENVGVYIYIFALIQLGLNVS